MRAKNSSEVFSTSLKFKIVKKLQIVSVAKKNGLLFFILKLQGTFGDDHDCKMPNINFNFF